MKNALLTLASNARVKVVGMRLRGSVVVVPELHGSLGPGTKTNVECWASRGYSQIMSASLLNESSYSRMSREVVMGCEVKLPQKINISGLNSLKALLYPSNKRLRDVCVESSFSHTSDSTINPM